ncbi:MAG: protein kinase [bacterium]|nr:protein kinase [bacterium]
MQDFIIKTSTGDEIEVYAEQLVKKSNQGTIVAGKHLGTNEDVVVKISHPFSLINDTDHTAGDKTHVLRELEILPQLSGVDGIPKFIASHKLVEPGKNERYIFAMSKVNGIDFEERRKQDTERRLTCAEATDLLKQVGLILQQAHERDIIHRDLKLSNFMISPDGKISIVDWGTAKHISQPKDSFSGSTPDHTVIGTVQFVSYEQITGQKLDQRTDIYSLGAVTALLRYGPKISQRYVIDEQGTVTQREKGKIAKAVAARETLKYELFPKPEDDCERTLQAVLKKMTDPDKEKRFQSMRAMIEAIS